MGEVVTYEKEGPKGTYCQIKLDSGERILFSIGQSGIQISKLSLGGLIPTSTIWKCEVAELPKGIMLFEDPGKPMGHPLDAMKDKLINYKSIDDVKTFLSAAEEKWIALQDAEEIIRAFGAVVENTAESIIKDVSELPTSKERIKEAFFICLANARTQEEREFFKVGLVFLTHFQPVGSKKIGVPSDDTKRMGEELEELSYWLKRGQEEERILDEELRAHGYLE